MEFFFSNKIDITAVFLDLALVILTTGVTYYLFSALPAKRRKKLLLHSLYLLGMKIDREFLEHEQKFKSAFQNHESSRKALESLPEWNSDIFQLEESNLDDLIITSLKRFPDSTEFSESWQVNELPSLLNSIILDNEKYLRIITNLSKLKRGLGVLEMLLIKFENGAHDEMDSETKEGIQLIAIETIYNVYEISNSLVDDIDDILVF